MGLRSASVRHPNVVVMAPALTETAEPHKFKLRPKTSSTRLSLKKFKTYKKNGSVSPTDAKPSVADSVCSKQAMNGHSPIKIIHSINGLIKTQKKEFISLNKSLLESKPETEKTLDQNGTKNFSHQEPKSSADYGLTSPTGGFSIMNDSTDPLGAGNMGLQKESQGISSIPDNDGVSPAKEKMSQGDVDQLFKNFVVELPDEISGGTDLAQNVDDIFQVLNNMEGNSVSDNPLGSTPSDGESIFNAGLTSLFSDDVMMNMCVDENLINLNKENIIKDKLEEALKKQFQLKRKCDFLMRRLRKLQSRTLGKHVCDEVTGILEYTSNLFDAFNRNKAIGSSDPSSTDLNCEVKSVSLSTLSLLMRQMEHSSSQQASYIAKNSNKQKYFGAGPSNAASTSNGMRLPGTIIPSFKPEIKKEINRVTGELSSQLFLLESEVDSDLTASSSGCDSCDELVSYNNLHQQTTPIKKRAIWRWAVERATLASRWTWLQAKMADLEYKIRQTNEMRRQLRQAKGVIRLAAKQSQPCLSLSANHASQESASSHPLNGLTEDSGGCARTHGVSSWSKRKLVKVDGLHFANKRAARQSTVKCTCRGDRPPCLICTGRPDPTAPTHTLDLLALNQRLVFFDSAFHPQLSFPSDVSQSIHYNALMKHSEWQMRAGRVVSGRGRLPRHATDPCVIGPSAAREAANAVVHTPVIRRDPPPPSATVDILEPKRCKVLPPAQSLSPGPSLSDLPTIAASLPPIGFRKKNPRGRRRKIPEAFKIKPLKKPYILEVADSSNSSSSRGGSCTSAAVEVEGIEKPSSVIVTSLFNGNDSSKYISPIPSPTPSKDQFKRKRENSYDIDNIVIPYCMAASTRPEKLNYKEILTPKWRLVKEEVTSCDNTTDLKNGVRRPSHEYEGEEDTSDETVITCHERCEVEERKKFLSYLKIGRGRGGRRVDSRAESSGPNTPDQALSPMDLDPPSPTEAVPPIPLLPQQSPIPHSLPPPAQAQSSLMAGPLTRKRTISLNSQPKSPNSIIQEVNPYELRIFPLSDEDYLAMVQEQKDFQEYDVDESLIYKNCEIGGSEITNIVPPTSPSTESLDSVQNADDPNDPEWTSSKNRA